METLLLSSNVPGTKGEKIVKRLSTRATAIPALTALGVLLLSQPAWSAPKNDAYCDPPATIEVLDDKTAERVTLRNGVTIITGLLTIEVSSAAGSETYNVSGPTQLNKTTGEVTLFGPSLILVPSSERDEAGSLLLNRGQITFFVNQPFEEQDRFGELTDVCADLA